ncbi:LAMI_0G09978g1_1 [Lachancea mirantina]|uniref:LAMI_0G09978g1_1 n=1 Tax=Lachancea mirantina TaxID=1230905 RepID=A0A1G4KAF9_9SACH|nr:LAMI_0G09978g1_1 [Lachancea mirantina]
MFDKKNVDYSLYLVTDSTMLPEGTTIESQVESGLQNGVTLVQLREKDIGTGDFVAKAQRIKKLCAQYNVPLIINDRVDVALAIDADGVHVGQDDMPVELVRKLLGPSKIIGWSVGYEHEVEKLAKWGPGGVDYIGIGMVFSTNTKKNPKKSPMGPRGVCNILDALQENKAIWCKAVAIGGLHPDNIPRVMYQCCSQDGLRTINGISLVSDIMAAKDAVLATKRLRSLIENRNFKFTEGSTKFQSLSMESVAIQSVVNSMKQGAPLVHHITNKVHQNFGANVALALGGSPIMSEVQGEFHELALIPHASLLLNTGSVAPLETTVAAVKAYNEAKRPVVLDPVGYSASTVRLNLNNHLLAIGQYVCIKGNAGEILSLAGLNRGKMKGVDAGDLTSDNDVLIKATRRVAYLYKTAAVCTGETDFVADGFISGVKKLSETSLMTADELPCYAINAGPLDIMGRITASGCSLGTTISTCVGGVTAGQSILSAVLTAVLLYKSAGYEAQQKCHGNGSFQVELIDALYRLSTENQPSSWKAKLSKV